MLAFALHLGGVAHGVSDFVRSWVGVALHEVDDCGDGSEDRCPADCPNCHCTHGAFATPPSAPPGKLVPFVATIVPAPVATSQRPARVDLSTIFRPPRFTSV